MQITENQYKFAKVRHDLRNDIESRRECTDEDNHGLVGCVRACVANTIAAFGWYLFSLFLSVLPILLFLHSGTWYQVALDTVVRMHHIELSYLVPGTGTPVYIFLLGRLQYSMYVQLLPQLRQGEILNPRSI